FADDLFKGKEYKDDEVIVIFKDDVSNKSIEKIVSYNDASLDEIIKVDDNKIVQATISDDSNLKDTIKDLSNSSKVLYAGPNYKYSFFENTIIDTKPSYWFDKLRILDTWKLLDNSNKTRVAVIDSGVDVYHEDLQENLIDTESYTITSGGEVLESDSDTDSHGTHVTGIIGATYGNKLGSAGVASGFNNDLVEIMVVGTSEEGYLYSSDIAHAISYATENGAKVINMSFGGVGRDRVVEEAVKDAYNKGVVLVAAAGNDSSDEFTSPSDFKEVISVNSSNEYDKANYWSDFGKYKDVTAPGNNIYSTLPGDIYGRMSGTSMAAPIVSGVVALMLDANPNLTPSQVYNILCSTTSQNGFNNYTAYGIINAKEAVSAAKSASSSESVTSISMKTKEEVVPLDDDISLEVLTKPATALKDVTWRSENPLIATVDSNGVVRGIKEGTTTIIASCDGKEVSTTVKVKAVDRITSLKFKDTTSLLYVGDNFSLSATYGPSDQLDPELYYSSSNRKVVDVEESLFGYVLVAKRVGSATVKVKNYDGSLSDTFDVTVREVPKRIDFNAPVTKLLIGEGYTYDVSATGKNYEELSYEPEIIWESTNPRVASIDEDGTVTAKRAGYTYITATAAATKDRNVKVSKSIVLYVGRTNYSGSIYGLRSYYHNYNTVELAWSRIYVAENYIIERATSKNGPFKVIGKTTDNYPYYTDTKLKMNTTYYYRIKARYNSSKVFGYSNVISVKPTIDRPNLALYNKKGYIKVSYSRLYDADGYFIYRSTKKNSGYKLVKRIDSSKTLYFNDKSVVKNKTYYYKVAGYKKINGKRVMGTFSYVKGKVYR
ncbi:MAG: S8 family serine peptidase, partial [bacterium]|nr:S8 family serine peptidase [bacterium]